MTRLTLTAMTAATAAMKAERIATAPLVAALEEVAARAPKTEEHLAAINALRRAMEIAPLAEVSDIR